MLHPHIPEEIKHFGKHLLATFLGLLMALGFEQWREHHQETKLSKEAVEAVHKELQVGIEQLELSKKQCEQSIQSLSRLNEFLAKLTEAKRTGKHSKPANVGINIGVDLAFETAAWDAMKNLGTFRLIPATHARKLSNAYLLITQLEEDFRGNLAIFQVSGDLFLGTADPRFYDKVEVGRLESLREAALRFQLVFHLTRNQLENASKASRAALQS